MKRIQFLLSLLFLFFFSVELKAQNNSLLFDGINDKVVVQGNSAIFNSSNFTIEAWINASTWKAQQWQGSIISKDQGNQSGFVLRCGANGTLSFTIGTGPSWPEITSTPKMLTNKWHHVAAVLENGSMKLYIDGVLEASNSGITMLNSTVDLHIGESAGFSGRVFDGRIDEVRFWNVARSQSEIANNDTVNLSPSTPGLVAYYKMNQISGTNLPNQISTPNSTGTLINFNGNPWVSGFEPTISDISADALISPNQLSYYHPNTLFFGKSKVKARFTNNGIDTITSFLASYRLNGINPVTETVNTNIFPGETFEYTFNTLLTNFTTNNDLLEVFANLSGDANALNDTVGISLEFNSSSPNTIIVFDRKQHNFGAAGQSHISRVSLPEDNTKYSQILMDISVVCPSTGCDPWDQPAKISLLKNGQSFELARFITPYGKGCGPWTIDVTDFKSLLRGSCDFSSYIQVWGPSGWLLNVSLTFVEAQIQNPYQKLSSLWSTDNWVYGDPGISYDLPARIVQIDSNTVDTDLRMTITGHGQGNTNNAAEFSQFTHQINVNGLNVNSHLLWKNDCAQNSCSNQFGTWLFSRAGWCPGEGVNPYHVNLNNHAIPGQNLTIDYVLQSYTNLLNTGYNGSSHTEPHYKIHSYLIEKSNVYIDTTEFTNLAAERITNPTLPPVLNPAVPVSVLLKNYGSTPIVDPELTLTVNDTFAVTEIYQGTIVAGDSLEYVFNTLPGFIDASRTYYINVIINVPHDKAPGDDVANLLTQALVSIDRKNSIVNSIKIFPNPSKGKFTIEATNSLLLKSGSIFTTTGKLLETHDLSGNTKQNTISTSLQRGIYLFKIEGENLNQSSILIIE